jgi:hypothetical protein
MGLFFLILNLGMRHIRRSIPPEMVYSIVLNIIGLSHQSSNSADPVLAMKHLVEAQSKLEVLSKLVGGNTSLGIITGIDIDYIEHTMVLQNQQLNIRLYEMT